MLNCFQYCLFHLNSKHQNVCCYAISRIKIFILYLIACDFNFYQYYYILGHLTLKEYSSMRCLSSLWSVARALATPLKTSSSVTNKGQSFDVNRRAVYHSLETGGGYEGLVSFCSIMNMPCLSPSAYYKQVGTILEALEGEPKMK